MPEHKTYLTPVQEKGILAQVAEGDTRSFSLLVDAYWNKVYSHALSFVKSPEAAQEITQDIFVKIWDKRAALPGIESFKDYLYITGRNMIISQMRKKIMAPLPTVECKEREDMQLPDLQLEYKNTYELIRRGMQQLTPQQQKIFRMSREEGMTHEQIAEKLGLAQNTVKWHMVIALNTLRTFLSHHIEMALVIIYLKIS